MNALNCAILLASFPALCAYAQEQPSEEAKRDALLRAYHLDAPKADKINPDKKADAFADRILVAPPEPKKQRRK